MSILKASGQYLGRYDKSMQCDFGILGVLPARILADVFYHRDYHYMANVSAIVIKLQQFNIDVLYKLSKDILEEIENEIIRDYKAAEEHDVV